MAEKSTKYFILMGDVVSSSGYEAKLLHKELKALIQSCNEELRADKLSPYTITLGDEFQGIATSLEASIKTLFFIEK
jgi:hypothetical protein